MFQRRKTPTDLRRGPSTHKEEQNEDSVHRKTGESKNTEKRDSRKSNVVSTDGHSGSKPSSITTHRWVNIKTRRKRDHPSPTGIVIEREHVYDVYGDNDDDLAETSRD